MRAVFELIGLFIVSLFFISVPILCTLSIVYNWYVGFRFLLIVVCFIEYFGLINLLLQIVYNQD